MIQLTGRHFLKIADYSPMELGFLLELAARLKAIREPTARCLERDLR